jgi:vacuolar-type H+-ATPase subunit I/STV1
MRDRIIECHVAWILGYVGYLLVLIVLAMTGILDTILRVPSPINEVLLLLLLPTSGLISCLYVCLKTRNRHASIALHCREAINVQISYTGYQIDRRLKKLFGSY